jgi:Transglutaminase-like superfamily
MWRRCGCDDEPGSWLGNAPGVELEAPGLKRLADASVRGAMGPIEEAVALFRYVSGLPFHLSDPAVRTVPQELHRQDRGDAYFKGALWVHLLRIRGIAARQRWVEIDPGKMTPGLWDFVRMAGMRFFHPLVEVWLAQRWITVDAYVMDPVLFEIAQNELCRRGLSSGFFVHRLGVCGWDGASDALQRFSLQDPDSLPLDDLGCFHSHRDFLDRTGALFERTELVIAAHKETTRRINVELERLRVPT